jgi:peptide/nickel transport system ATP-binding protein
VGQGAGSVGIGGKPTDQDPLHIKVKDLDVQFHVGKQWVPATSGVCFEVKKGEVLAIVGESGSGKSSTAMALLNLLPSNSRVTGSVEINGTELIGMSESSIRKIRGNKIAVIFQEPMTALNPVLTIGFQIVETLREHFQITRAAAKSRALELLEMVELADPLKAFGSYPHQLSGGQRQRAMIAQSISCDPELLIADEPTTALDVTVQAEILDLLRNLKARLGMAILLITHDMGVVADVADRVLVMRNGRVVERGTVAKIFYEPAHQCTVGLLEAIPRLGATDERARIKKRGKEPVLALRNVSVDYLLPGRNRSFRAVENVSIDIYPGELMGLVGESGSGKSTIGRAAMGLQRIAEGELHVLGRNMATVSRTQLRKLRRGIGIVFQDPGSTLNPRMSIGQSIREPLILGGASSTIELDRAVDGLLDMVELPSAFRSRYPHELSGGQKQRVGIARALSLRPQLLIADEPTSALDVSVQSRFLELLVELQGQLDFACLFISHDLAVVDRLAHRVAVMKDGALIELGSRDDILLRPANTYTKLLIASVPIPDPREQSVNRAHRLATRR